jgi:hypothetical protein
LAHTLPNLTDYLGGLRGKARKRLPTLGRHHSLPPIPDLSQSVQAEAPNADTEYDKLVEATGSETMAKRILKLKKQYPNGTYPELVVMDWLMQHNVKWAYQFWVLGGKVLSGGQVVDFVVDVGSRAIVIEVQGNYWHTRGGSIQHDFAERLALLGITIWGKKVGVVEVWESRIMDKYKRDHAMQMALLGIEVGR